MVRTSVHRRAGFTLVEALVVVSIIVILASLTTAAVVRALQSAEDAKVLAESRQLQNAITAFKLEYKVPYLPSRFRLRPKLNQYVATDPLDRSSKDYLTLMFPRLPQDVAIPWTDNMGGNSYDLNGSECLVFFLGGAQRTTTTGQPDLVGWSSSANNPIPATRGKTFYDFDVNRIKRGIFKAQTPLPGGASQLQASASPFAVYMDPYLNNNLAEDQPYYYFTSYADSNYSGRDQISGQVLFYSTYDVRLGAVVDSIHPSNFRFANPSTNQIISAGRDKRIGNHQLTNASAATGTNNGFTPWSNGQYLSTAASPKDGQDNICNFHPVKMGVPQ